MISLYCLSQHSRSKQDSNFPIGPRLWSNGHGMGCAINVADMQDPALPTRCRVNRPQPQLSSSILIALSLPGPPVPIGLKQLEWIIWGSRLAMEFHLLKHWPSTQLEPVLDDPTIHLFQIVPCRSNTAIDPFGLISRVIGWLLFCCPLRNYCWWWPHSWSIAARWLVVIARYGLVFAYICGVIPFKILIGI